MLPVYVTSIIFVKKILIEYIYYMDNITNKVHYRCLVTLLKMGILEMRQNSTIKIWVLDMDEFNVKYM